MSPFKFISCSRTILGVLWIVSVFTSCKWTQDSSVQHEAVARSTSPVMSLDTTYFNDKLPMIEGVNPYGDSFSIRQIQAKFILLEFWASWCPPCRRANPGLVEVYNKYKSQGFDIVSISLDTDKQKWKRAIEDDQLAWPYHLCDYKGWNSPWAVQYSIEEIPNNVLYNSEGKILAKSLDPSSLDRILQDLVSK